MSIPSLQLQPLQDDDFKCTSAVCTRCNLMDTLFLHRQKIFDRQPVKRARWLVKYSALRLRSHRHEYEYEYESGFPFTAIEASLVRVESSRSLVYKHITLRLSAILNKIESKKCFAIETTIFHYKVTILTNRTSLTMNNFTMTSVLTSNMRHGFFINYINAIYE